MPSAMKAVSYYEQAQVLAPELVRLRRAIHANRSLAFTKRHSRVGATDPEKARLQAACSR